MQKAEDGGSFPEVYSRYKTGVYQFCRRMLADNDEAKDVVQEVFIRLFENHIQLDNEAVVKVWLFKSARNKCLNRIRDRGKLSNIGAAGDQLPASESSDHGFNDSSSMIEKLFDNLPVDYKEVLVMREWNEMSYVEIAGLLDTTVSAVKSKLFKARKKASEVYKKLYGDE